LGRQRFWAIQGQRSAMSLGISTPRQARWISAFLND
jgi:hypothetical protein